MARKKHQPGPVPPANRPHAGPDFGRDEPAEDEKAPDQAGQGAAFAEQDPKRRLGDFETAGEHSFQQPGGKNDANQ
jgi:hypothetical protein